MSEHDSEEHEEDALREHLEKVARLAVERGVLKPFEEKGAIGQSLLAPGDKRAFLRRLLERKGGLTTDEARNLERDALAPPPPPPTLKPLPDVHAQRKDSAKRRSSGRIVSSGTLPSLSGGPKEKREENVQVFKGKKLPKLRGDGSAG